MHPLLEEVLKLDPEHKEAQVLAAFTRPIMAFRGFYYRSANLLKQYPNKAKNRFGMSGVEILKFLNAKTTASPINTDEDLQSFLNEIHTITSNSRKILKANREIDSKYDQYVDGPQDFDGSLDELLDKALCEVTRKGNLLFVADEKKCSKGTVSLNEANVASMLFHLMLVDAGAIFYNSFQTKGVLALDRIRTHKGLNITSETQIEFLKSIPEFGLLKTTHQLKQLISLGADSIPALKYMAKNLKNICRVDTAVSLFEEPKENNDVQFKILVSPNYAGAGGTLYRGCIATADNRGVGTSESFENILQYVTHIVSGKSFVQIFGRENSYQTEVHPRIPIDTPAQDLKILLPTEYNECGNPLNVGEETLGGLFPSSDATKALTIARRLGKKCS